MDSIEAGWYQDPDTAGQQRYHDGSTWTDHTAPIEPDPQYEPPVDGAAGDVLATEAVARSKKQPSRLGELGGLAFIGAFVGLLFGGFVFNGVGSLTPLTTEPGTLERLDISYSTGSSSNRRSYELHGTTASGDAWKITNEDAYRIVESQGYPQQVMVGIGDWTGTAEVVTGDGWDVDHQTTGARVGWGIAIGILVVGGALATVLIGRAKKFRLAGAAVFAASYFLIGGWLGYIVFGWFQSG